MDNKISDLRSYHGVSQRALARRVGISSAAMSAIERGVHVPNVTTAIRIARELKTTVEELWGDTAKKQKRVTEEQT